MRWVHVKLIFHQNNQNFKFNSRKAQMSSKQSNAQCKCYQNNQKLKWRWALEKLKFSSRQARFHQKNQKLEFKITKSLYFIKIIKNHKCSEVYDELKFHQSIQKLEWRWVHEKLKFHQNIQKLERGLKFSRSTNSVKIFKSSSGVEFTTRYMQ